MLFHVFPQSGIRKFSHLFVSCFALVVVSALLLFFHPPKVYSAQMTLAWDPNTEPDLRGYKVYYGTSSGTYGVPLYVRNVTDYTLTGLTEGQVYYIAVTAYDKSGNESVYSNEVSGAAREPTQIYTYTVATNPPRLQITVDGATHRGEKKFSWIPGTSHTLSVESPQSGPTGVRYAYASWSDGGDQGHTMIAPSSNTEFMATFNVQWAEDTSVSQNPIVISVNSNMSIVANFSETVSTPNVLNGSREDTDGTSYLFKTGGSTSSFGDPVQYLFDWGDGINSGWLAVGTTTASHSWNTPGTYPVKSQARCSSHPSAVSNWSEPMTIVIERPPLTMIGAIDYPVDGQRVSGITTIDGWALDGRGISKVELFVDDQFIGNIAYGSTLMDIKEIYPDYPGAENSGFCVIWNASGFSPGDHKIKVRLHNLDGHTKDLEVSTTVVKFHGKFVESISPSRNVLYYSEVTAEGTTQVYDIEIEWSKVSQGFVITEIKPR
jgi:hypothetical protein